MSLFGELDVASAEDDPFSVPAGMYESYLTSVKVGPTKAGDKVGMSLEYTINGGDHAGKKVTEWKEIPRPSDPKNPSAEDKRAMSFLKQRMLNLGIPEARI